MLLSHSLEILVFESHVKKFMALNSESYLQFTNKTNLVSGTIRDNSNLFQGTVVHNIAQ